MGSAGAGPQPPASEYAPSRGNVLGRMTALSYPVITLPVMLVLMGTIYYIFSTVGKLTGLELEEMMKQKPKKGQPAPAIVSEEAGDHVVGEQQSSRS